MMPSANTPLFYGSNWVVRLGQVWMVDNELLVQNPRPTERISVISWTIFKDSSEEMRRLRPEGRIFGLGQADAPTAASLEFTFAVFGTAEPLTGSDREAQSM